MVNYPLLCMYPLIGLVSEKGFNVSDVYDFSFTSKWDPQYPLIGFVSEKWFNVSDVYDFSFTSKWDPQIPLACEREIIYI